MSPRPVSQPAALIEVKTKTSPSPRPSHWPLASMPRSHLPHARCLCVCLSCTHFLSSLLSLFLHPWTKRGDKDGMRKRPLETPVSNGGQLCPPGTEKTQLRSSLPRRTNCLSLLFPFFKSSTMWSVPALLGDPHLF